MDAPTAAATRCPCSDRRNNRDGTGKETGEYGWEDFVNPGQTNGAPNGALDEGEDVNANGVLDVYGGFPAYDGSSGVPPGSVAPFTTAARPTSTMSPAEARVNRPIFFRRALKLIDRVADCRPQRAHRPLRRVREPGVQSRATGTRTDRFNNPHAATAVMADSVSILSSNWDDIDSLDSPYVAAGRTRRKRAWSHMAIIGGKNAIFRSRRAPRPRSAQTAARTRSSAIWRGVQ